MKMFRTWSVVLGQLRDIISFFSWDKKNPVLLESCSDFNLFNGYLNLEIPGIFVIAYVASLANAFIEDLTSSSGLHFSYHTVSQYVGC